MQIQNTNTAPRAAKTDGVNLMAAHAQWRDRPEDERFMTAEDARNAARAHRARCMSATSAWADMRAETLGAEIVIVGKAGVPVPMTNYAFGQLASLVKAPAGYLRSLPADLAAKCVQQGITERREANDASLLLSKDDDALRLRCITSAQYARIWNVEIAEAMMRLQDRHPTWGNPEAFRMAEGQARNAWGKHEVLPCAFVGDRDCFFFFCDYTKTVRVPGYDHPMARGFFLSNSEVGNGAVTLTTFLFDTVCCNMIVWNATNVTKTRIVHTGDARDRFLSTGANSPLGAINAFVDSSASADEARILRATNTIVANTLDDAKVLIARKVPLLSQATVSAAYEIAAGNPRYGNPLSVWGLVNGITEHSQKATTHASERTALDIAAGKLLTMKF